MIHISSFSGGVGSFMATKRMIELYGVENSLMVFTDTLTEDWDLYRYVVESIGNIYGKVESYDYILMKARALEHVSPFEQPEKWRTALTILAGLVNANYPQFRWLMEGRDVWQVYFDEKFIGNSRVGNCTMNLKQKIFRKWLEENYSHEEAIPYIGIDWTEYKRYEKAIDHWLPYQVKAPLCDEPYIYKDEMFEFVKSQGIEIPRLYKMGFAHNNCGGFCVKAGHGHFKQLLEQMPERYEYHEKKEQEWQEYTGKKNTILKDRRGGKPKPLTLMELRERIEEAKAQEEEMKKAGQEVAAGCKVEQLGFDFDDIGGCGCYPY